jgi:glycerophosphoryl diester phosphodiesterase
VAHRGLHHRAPENSFYAFYLAATEGVPWVECDVWASSDGAVVVLHDEMLDRTTTGRGPVWRRNWEDLYPLNLKYADGRVDRHSTLKSLPEVLGAADRAGTSGFLVEIKPCDARDLVWNTIDILKRERCLWIVQSFDEANLIHALVHDPMTPVALLVEERGQLERGLQNGWKSIHLSHDLLDAETARRMRGGGVSIGVWTPNTEEELRRVIELEADIIITDEPLLARELIARVRSEPATNRNNSVT